MFGVKFVENILFTQFAYNQQLENNRSIYTTKHDFYYTNRQSILHQKNQ